MKLWVPLQSFSCGVVGAAAALGCGNDFDASASGPAVLQPLSCPPNESRPCPCEGGIWGTQVCAGSGREYGSCLDCTEPNPSTSTSDPPSDRALTRGGTPSEGDSEPAGDDATAGDATPEEAGAAVAADMDSALGTSCGVGLPTVCELGASKCCVRSLETDTCIDSDANCGCATPGCTTLVAHCDGPEDCDAGEVCCGDLAGFDYRRFSCQRSCAFDSTQRIACHQAEPQCPEGTVCSNSQILTNLQVCIDPATIEQ